MPIALICSPSTLEAELSETAVWREGLTRHVVRTADEALKKAAAVQADIVLVDRDMAGADRIVSAVRRDPLTRRSSIVIIARGDMDHIEVELLEAGANAILRLPVSPDWDERLTRLIEVPVRREMRVPVRFEMEARSGDGVESQTATVLNISVSGILIDSGFPLRMGDDLDVSFQLPDSEVVIRGTGRVVRQSGRTQFGLEFYGLEGEGRDLIAAYIASPSLPE
jgi:DNA-binding response OmpR family regulator